MSIYEYPWGGWLEHGICALGDSTRPATSGVVVRIGYLPSRGLRWRHFRGCGARLARLAHRLNTGPGSCVEVSKAKRAARTTRPAAS